VRVCVSGVVVEVAAIQAEWQVRQSTVQVSQGDEFSVTCVVTSLTPIDVVRLVLRRPGTAGDTDHHHRQQDVFEGRSGTPFQTLTWTLADNYDVKEPFSSLSRYRLYYSYKDGVATSTLTYRGLCLFFLFSSNSTTTVTYRVALKK